MKKDTFTNLILKALLGAVIGLLAGYLLGFAIWGLAYLANLMDPNNSYNEVIPVSMATFLGAGMGAIIGSIFGSINGLKKK
ncbi:hypothetical protein GF340_02255 [Candidatus Peregrinibacteria bacterium]|nr:hypothetical protein [Candidatus Peregrinibacteria bacterium]